MEPAVGPRPDQALQRLLDPVEVLLLDFDGPVCSVFAGLPAREVAARLCALPAVRDLADAGAPPPADPLDVLRRCAAAGPAVMRAVEVELTRLEVLAVESALATSGALELLIAVRASGRRTVIVSNNAAAAVEAHLRRTGMRDLVQAVAGRDPRGPGLLKPHPYLVRRGRALSGLPRAACLLVGDAVTDVTAAHRAGVPAIGFANKPHKVQALRAAGADAVVTGLREVTGAL